MSESVSVVVPTYNRSTSLRYVIEALLSQSHPVAEVIIVDDGSSDDTAEMIRNGQASRPDWREKVRYIYQQNQGQSAAINNGLSVAKSEWIGFCAHDDLWLPWKLHWQFRALNAFKGECGLCFTDAWFMNNPYMKGTLFQSNAKPDSKSIGRVEDAPMLVASGKHPIWMQTVIARADLIRQAGGMDPKLRYSEDHDFVFRMALITKFCFISMPMVLIDRSPADERHTGEARNWHKEEYCLGMDQRRFEKQLKLSDGLPPATKKMILQNLRRLHSNWANLYLEQKDYKKALGSIAQAAKFELTASLAAKWALTRILPGFTRWMLIRDRGSEVRFDRVSWEADDTPSLM